MASPIRVTADLSEGLNAILRLIPDGARAVGERLMEEWDDRRDSRRMRNIAAAAVLAVPEMNADATAPDDDWLSEWFDLASKRSHQDWQHAIAKMLSNESNAPGSVPLRYFTDMARLDKDVLDLFRAYCGYYVSDLGDIVKTERTFTYTLIAGANLVFHHDRPTVFHIHQRSNALYQSVDVSGRRILIKNGKYELPMGNIRLTDFGRFIYSLLDHPPPQAPDQMESLREMWKEHLYEGDLAE